jgi:uroporphyrinogen-III synthase
MLKPSPLDAWTIVSLRPQGLHSSIRQLAKYRKAHFCALSVTKLVAIPNCHELAAALTADIRIMSSPTAVSFAQQQADLSGHWLAIGQNTAKRLFSAGANSVLVPEPQTADGLLALEVMQKVSGLRLGLITAPNGRGILEKTLQERGALLNVAHVYQRLPISLNRKQLSYIDAFSPQTAIFVTSSSAFAALWQQLNANRQAIMKSLLYVASSARLVEYLQFLGIRSVLQSSSTLPHDQIRTLAQAVLPDEPTGAMDD